MCFGLVCGLVVIGLMAIGLVAIFIVLRFMFTMWFELMCCLVICIVLWFLFDDDDGWDVEKTDSGVLFSVANKIEKLCDGKVYAGLRIPDANTGSREDIDMVLVTKGGAMVISVKNFSGIISIAADGSWVCKTGDRRKAERHLDPVAEAKKRISILESYFEQRGVALPEGYVSCQVILANPEFCSIHSNDIPSEVITYDQWTKLKPEAKSLFSGWFKGGLRAGKKEMQESIDQRLNFVLSTAPMWDRLELKGNKYVLGEFLEFNGEHDDTQALRNIKRSKVSQLIPKFSIFDFAPSKVKLSYSPRDYRNDSASASEWKEVTIGSSTEVLFRPQNYKKVRKFKLSSILSMSLSA